MIATEPKPELIVAFDAAGGDGRCRAVSATAQPCDMLIAIG
jgi:hypothetical protein